MKPASHSSKQRKKQATKSGPSGEIRIIGGQWRGRKLAVNDKEGLRPTTDRLKETLFNWLMTNIREARVLDCFAGAGSLGFEAASRHATHVTCIEKDKRAATQLVNNTILLNAKQLVHVIQGDFFSQSKNLNKPFDLIFIDPPFNHDYVKQAVPCILENNLLESDGLLYIEQEKSSKFDLLQSDWAEHFELIKHKSAGQVSASLYKKVT